MSLSIIDNAASHLLAARRSGIGISALNAHPSTLEEAFAVQDRLGEMLGERVAGWKAGFTEAGEVLQGAMFASTVLESGASYAPTRFTAGYEGELAFRFLRDLPPRKEAYSREEVMAAVAILPAIEIVATRFANPAIARPLDRIADNNVNGGFVAGPEIRDWQSIDLANLKVTFAVDGKVVLQKTGNHPAGDPFAPALALANRLREGRGISAGQVITTGAPTGCIPVARGSGIAITFESIGTVTLSLT